MKNKKGVSLIILVITIVLILILVGTLTADAGNSIGNSRISTFASDLSEIEDATKTYYMLNNEFPSIDGKAYNQGEIIAIVPEKYQGKFKEELQLNNDDVSSDSNGTYYMIDLSKIDIEQSTRGSRLDESDVYVVVYPSMNVYYLEGLRANNEVYFSLSSKITKLTQIVKEETVEEGSTSLTTSDGIIIKKETDKWSNELNIVIESNFEENESLYIQLGDSQKYEIETVTGRNVLQLQNNFTTIYSSTTNQEMNTGIIAEDIEIFNNLPQENKKITVTKESFGSIKGIAVLELSNFENDLPSLISEISLHNKTYDTLLYFDVNDDTSGIDKVKYEYLTKIDEYGNINPYFENIESFDDDYMRSRAQTAYLTSGGVVFINIPMGIESVQINIFDKAGNSSGKIVQKVVTDLYIGIYETEVTRTSLKANLVVKVPTGDEIKSATISVSNDALNFANEQNIELVENSNGTYNASISYDKLTNITNKMYVKVNLNYGDNYFYKVKELDVNTIKV